MPAAGEDLAYERFCRTGDPDAIAEVYDRTVDRLLRTAIRLTRNPAEAEDALQATYVAAIERSELFESGRRVLPWLLGILTRQIKLLAWRARRTPELDRLAWPETPQPSSAAERREFEAALDRAIDQLPEAYRAVMLLRLRHGLAAGEIAHSLGRPPGTVRAQLTRGLEKLRRSLPAGYVSALAMWWTPERGLAAVRRSVTAAAGTALVGGIVMKKTLLVAVVVAIACLSIPLWSDGESAPESIGTAEPRAAEIRRAPVTAADRESVVAERAPVELDAASERRAEPAVPARGTLLVGVVWRDTGEPASGVVVTATPQPARGWESSGGTETDGQGFARLGDLRPGEVLLATALGGQKLAEVVADEERGARLSIPRGCAIHGRVVDGEGLPIPGAAVWMSEAWRDNRGFVVARTDPDGRFGLEHVTAHRYVSAFADGYAPSRLFPVPARVGESYRLEIVLAAGGGEVRARVVDAAGRPIAGAAVLIGDEHLPRDQRSATGEWVPGPPPRRACSDAHGRVVVRSLPAGRRKVQVRAEGYRPLAVEIDTGELDEHELRLDAGAGVRGEVRDSTGRPAAGVKISVGTGERFRDAVTYSGASGRFELVDLDVGQVTVSAHRGDEYAVAGLTLAAGRVTPWNPALRRVLAAEPELRGRVIDREGRGIADWRVVAWPGSGGSAAREGRTDDDGYFGFAVPEPEVHVRTHPPHAAASFPAAMQDVVVADGPVTLVAGGDSGRLAGVVVDERGQPAAAEVQVWHEDWRLFKSFESRAEDGRFEIDPVPAGRVSISVRSGDYPWVKLDPRTVEADARVDVGTVTLRRGARIRGTVRLPTGAAVSRLRGWVLDERGMEVGAVEVTGETYSTTALPNGELTLMLQGDRCRSVRERIVITGGDLRRDYTVDVAAVRRVQLVFDDALPPWVTVHVRDAASTLLWNGGVQPRATTTLDVSVPLGRHRVSAMTRNGNASAELVVTALEDVDEVLTIRVR